MASLDEINAAILARQLQMGDRGNLEVAREAHGRLAQVIRDSNMPAFERDCLARMHQAIADGMDARMACSVSPKRGQFSRTKRDVDIWFAINELASEAHVDWKDAARRLFGNIATAKRFGLNSRLPASVATLENIYRKVEAAYWEANESHE